MDTAKRLISGLILLEEAECKRLSATKEEIEAMVSDIKENYYNMPEVAKLVDDYCKGAEITIDAYFSVLEKQAPETLSRQKLKNQFGGKNMPFFSYGAAIIITYVLYLLFFAMAITLFILVVMLLKEKIKYYRRKNSESEKNQ